MFLFSIDGVESYNFQTNTWKHETVQQIFQRCGKTKYISHGILKHINI